MVFCAMTKDELPCFECEHAEIVCGEITCLVEKRAVHLLERCPLGLEI